MFNVYWNEDLVTVNDGMVDVMNLLNSMAMAYLRCDFDFDGMPGYMMAFDNVFTLERGDSQEVR